MSFGGSNSWFFSQVCPRFFTGSGYWRGNNWLSLVLKTNQKYSTTPKTYSMFWESFLAVRWRSSVHHGLPGEALNHRPWPIETQDIQIWCLLWGTFGLWLHPLRICVLRVLRNVFLSVCNTLFVPTSIILVASQTDFHEGIQSQEVCEATGTSFLNSCHSIQATCSGFNLIANGMSHLPKSVADKKKVVH